MYNDHPQHFGGNDSGNQGPNPEKQDAPQAPETAKPGIGVDEINRHLQQIMQSGIVKT